MYQQKFLPADFYILLYILQVFLLFGRRSNADMTVSYTLEVANARFGGFSKLLFRWKGSIYRLLYKELLVFCGVYLFVSLFYR